MHDTDRFRELDRLFQAVCDLPRDEREARLIELAPSDASLRSEVLELLEAESRADSAHRLAPDEIHAEVSRALHTEADDPESLAGYRIVSRLGSGGMGVVYEAEQRSPKRTVALKVLRPGLATPELVRRFEFEVEALGRLRHPGIARVYEAGVADTPAGQRPFFAMELVHGEQLDQWAERVGAPPRARLELMARICEAVQHAHAQGVIHRDLKPANILVSEDGSPVVLDFGVARAAETDANAESLQTLRGQLVGTLPYMSPEQLAGDPVEVDTRSDIYALGVVLFELMSGRLPHDVSERGLVDAARLIRESEPTKLSELDSRLRGDVETIAGKAMEKAKDRRYQSASAMADDIRRHLAGLTIAARPPSAMYQLSRLARRHRPAAVAAVVVLLALIGTAIGVSLALTEAIEQRKLAEQRENEANRQTAIATAVTDFVNNDVLAAVVPSAQGHEVTVRQALDTAADSLDGRFHDEPVTGAAIRNNIANVYTALGEFARAEPLTIQARDTFLAELGPDDPLTQFAEQDVGALQRDTGRYDEAREQFERLLSARERTLGFDHPDTLNTLLMLAELERDGFGDLSRASELLAEFEARRAGKLTDDDPIVLFASLVRGGIALEMTDYETAATDYRRVAEARERDRGSEHPSTLIAWHNLAVAYEKLGRYDEAEPIYKRGLEIERRLAGDDNPDTLVTAHNLAFLYESMERYDEAEPLYLDTLERCRRVFGPVHPGTLTCTQSLASLYRATERADEALELLETAFMAARSELGPESPPSIELGWSLAVVYVESDRAPEAEAMLASIMPAAREMLPPGHPMLGSMLSAWGECLTRLERYGEAEVKLNEAYEILQDAPTEEGKQDAALAAERLSRNTEAAALANDE